MRHLAPKTLDTVKDAKHLCSTSNHLYLNANKHPLPHNWKQTIALIWSGQAASILATCAATFAALWYITTTEDSAIMLAAGGIAALLPTAILSPFGGVIADTHNRKRVMIIADGTAGLFSLILALLIIFGFLSIPLLLLLLTIRSAAQAFHGTSLMALMPELVSEDNMIRINTLDQSLTSASAIIGPILGIALYTALGFAAVLILDAACALFACICLALTKLPYAKNIHPTSCGVLADLSQSLTLINAKPGILPLLVLVMAAMLIFLPLGTLSPLMTYQWFGGNGFAASAVEASAGIGLLVGSIVMLIWGGGKRFVPILITSGLLIGVGCIGAGLLPQSGFFVFVILVSIIFAATAAFNAPILPLMQKQIPQEYFGRVMGIFGSLTALASPIGLCIAGPAAEACGVNHWFVVCGFLLCLCMLFALLSRSLRKLDTPTSSVV